MLLEPWQSPYTLYRVHTWTGREVHLRPLLVGTNADALLRLPLSSSRLHQPSNPLHECWPFSTCLSTVDCVTPELLLRLQTAAALCSWERQEGKRYQFGAVNLLTNDTEACKCLIAEVKQACVRAWGRIYGGDFWTCFTINCSNAHFLKYGPGTTTPPPHLDLKASDDGLQVGNVIIYLTEPEAGGQTVLDVGSCAGPPVSVEPLEGRILAWFSYTPGGVLDPRALHTANPVTMGEKVAFCLSIHRPWDQESE
jgi:hypothetical protein